jgi:hypothetical protein
MLNARAGLLVAAALAGVVLSSCSNSPSASSGSTTTTTTTTTATAACTRAAITAGAMSSPSNGPVSSVNGYGCSGTWAYADVVVGTTNSFDAVLVLQAVGPNWTVADRATACNNHLVPSAIYTQACTTS